MGRLAHRGASGFNGLEAIPNKTYGKQMFPCALWNTKNAVYAVALRTTLVRPQQGDTIAGSLAQRTIRLSS